MQISVRKVIVCFEFQPGILLSSNWGFELLADQVYKSHAIRVLSCLRVGIDMPTNNNMVSCIQYSGHVENVYAFLLAHRIFGST